jgi:hypothetical protein
VDQVDTLILAGIVFSFAVRVSHRYGIGEKDGVREKKTGSVLEKRI